ncbi:MAG TPA: prolyl oligopeptidase family serine peptidase [Planctomycetota bacterium]|nr:prolyl oligopeptidase family serine peptidase [Planctomycetota bacterium]
MSILRIGSLLLAAACSIPVFAAQDARVYRDRIDAHWFAGGQRFWYRNDLPGGKREFILVDAEKGTRAAAFDAGRAAAAIGKASVESLRFDDDLSAVVLQTKDKAWRLNLKSYEATPDKIEAVQNASLPSSNRPRPSRRTGDPTTLTFLNHTKGAIDIYWLDTAGERKHYAEVKPGESWESTTYDGHVWLVTDKNNVTQGVFEATRDPSTAIVGEGATAGLSRSEARDRDTSGQARSGTRSRAGGDSPDGKWSAFVRDFKLVVRNTKTNEELILGDDGKVSDSYAQNQIWWSPDSTKFLAMRTEPAQEHKIYEVESSPKDQVQPKLKTLDYLKPGDRIAHPRPQLFDIAAKKHVAIKEDLFANPWSIDSVRWMADSSRVTFLYNQRGHQALRIVAVDGNGEPKAIVDETSKTFICYSGKYFCRWIGDKEIIWMSERDGWNHLWRYDAQTGAVKTQITKGEWVVQNVTQVDEAARQIWFTAGGIRPGQDPYYTHFCRVNFDGTGLTILTEGDGTHSTDWSPGKPYFIDTYSRIDMAPVNELRRSDTGALCCKLEEADASEALAARGGRWPERFASKGRDGVTDIFGMIIFPRDFDPAKKYPIVENIYAGPQGFFTPKNFRRNYGTMQTLANRGMIVVQCDGMGTSGRSKKFHDVCFKNLRDAGFDDRVAWIKAAAAKFPALDLTRVGIYGGSAGGQNAMAALLWHNDFYKVAVADCGCHDNRMDKIWWNEQWMGWPVDKSYEENSNAVNAHLLKGKLMLMVGELDSNVDPASTMQVVAALEKANKEFDYVVVAGANHGSAETPYGSMRRMNFLVRNLLGKE